MNKLKQGILTLTLLVSTAAQASPTLIANRVRCQVEIVDSVPTLLVLEMDGMLNFRLGQSKGLHANGQINREFLNGEARLDLGSTAVLDADSGLVRIELGRIAGTRIEYFLEIDKRPGPTAKLIKLETDAFSENSVGSREVTKLACTVE